MGKYLIAFQLMIVGMGTVLITLYVLSLFIRMNSKFFAKKDTAKTVKEDTFTANKKLDDNLEQGISTRKVAAISAAIYKFLDDRSNNNYKIISIKRNKSNWKK